MFTFTPIRASVARGSDLPWHACFLGPGAVGAPAAFDGTLFRPDVPGCDDELLDRRLAAAGQRRRDQHPVRHQSPNQSLSFLRRRQTYTDRDVKIVGGAARTARGSSARENAIRWKRNGSTSSWKRRSTSRIPTPSGWRSRPWSTARRARRTTPTSRSATEGKAAIRCWSAFPRPT